MATNKTRITISLDPRVYEVYKDFAALNNQPTATAIAEMLVDAYPMIMQSVALFRSAKEQSDLTRSAMLTGLAEGIEDLRTVLGRVVPQVVIDDYGNVDVSDKSPRASNTGASYVKN